MHINPNSSTNIRAAATPSVSHTVSPSARPIASVDESSDGVQLSRLSSVLNGLAAGAAFGAKRISSLSALVQSGAYQVHPVQVSQRMIDDALSAG